MAGRCVACTLRRSEEHVGKALRLCFQLPAALLSCTSCSLRGSGSSNGGLVPHLDDQICELALPGGPQSLVHAAIYEVFDPGAEGFAALLDMFWTSSQRGVADRRRARGLKLGWQLNPL